MLREEAGRISMRRERSGQSYKFITLVQSAERKDTGRWRSILRLQKGQGTRGFEELWDVKVKGSYF